MKNKLQVISYKLLVSKLFVSLIIGLLGYWITAPQALAEQRIITVVPPSATFQLNPGDKTEGVLKVINDSDQLLTFSANTQDFIVEDTQGTPTLLNANTLNNKYSAASWIAVYPNNFIIGPHQKQTLNYYIQIPQNARPGGHYAAVVYSPAELLGVKGTGAAVQTQIGTLFSIVVNGQVTQYATTTKFSANPFQEFGPVDILTQIKNYGDVHIKPVGTITITDILGRKVATLPLEEHNIFPSAARDYVNVFGQQWMIGPFKATLLASYGAANNMPIVATITFWVFPWRAATAVLLVIIAIILAVLLWKRKKRHDKMIDEMNDQMPLSQDSNTQ